MTSATSDTPLDVPAESTPTSFENIPGIAELNPEEVAECMRTGRPIKELLGLGDEVWETMYDFGYRNFINAQYELAEYWWTQTCLFDSMRDRNWIALSVACKRQNKYEQALNALSLAVHNGSTNPWAPLHAAECHLQLDHLQQATLALKDVDAWADNSDDKEMILKRAKMLRRGIERRLAKNPSAAETSDKSTDTQAS